MSEPFTRLDFESAVWQKLKAYLERRITTHRLELEDLDLAEIPTAKLRARIDEDRILLALDQAPAQEAADD